eukprot:TRINITY_DN8469_c0_g1_i1.p1 TRINITY_DN8469_c0_g1~~TRINITY_DN8469_c0_g1_i1.p1  ORF type:complete len:281 (+),score=37.49 TRINITY_DN8469_c0_g1_i1:577-1419(+)
MEGAVLVWQEPYNHPNSMEQLHHPRPVWCCVLLGEGDKVATGCEGGMLRIWSQDEFGGWDLEREFRAHDKRISAVAVSTNPERLASGSHDMTVRVWTRLLLLDAVPAESCLTLSGHKAFVTSVDFSSDGSVLASGSFDMSAIVWDLATGTASHHLQHHHHPVLCVGLDPWQAAIVVTGCRGGTLILTALTKPHRPTKLQAHADRINSCTFYQPSGSDERRILSASSDGSLRVWGVLSGECLLRFESCSPIRCLSVWDSVVLCGADGKLVALDYLASPSRD